ncbi:MAG: transglycosylase SLT domain-containing protein [Anaerolineaceae bacterium]|nr:transglycosylase SLT domain-containing protein [Anaerolineaceae bacterium]
MSVQKMIFPGLLLGILSLIGVTSLLAISPVQVSSAAPPPVQAQEQPQEQAAVDESTPNLSSECSLSGSYPETILQWCGLIEQYARDNTIDANLVSAVMLQESAGRPDAYSKSGAVGLMQVMPRDGKAAGFVCKNGPCFADRPSMSELFDPEYNVAYGTQMLANLLRKHGDMREALRAYGPMDVGYYYADLVLGIMNTHQ